MRIDRVTITGADDKVDREELAAFTMHYPFVEWGILFSESRTGSPRYPLASKIMGFADFGLPLSAHLCGNHSRNVMEGRHFGFINNLPEAFKRIQINYNFHKSSGWQVAHVLDWATKHPDRSIIFQDNSSNAAAVWLIEANISGDNVHFLYDSSGGRGVEIEHLKPPHRTYTGYSGGIHPDNIRSIVDKIYSHKLKNNVWLDMESGVRTENQFDSNKVSRVLTICQEYITQNTLTNGKE